MIRQDFPVKLKPSTSRPQGRKLDVAHVWEVRHAGLLGIKYEVAVRADLVESRKIESPDETIIQDGREVLKGVVDAAVLG